MRPHQHLPRPRRRIRDLLDLHHLRPAKLTHDDGSHIGDMVADVRGAKSGVRRPSEVRECGVRTDVRSGDAIACFALRTNFGLRHFARTSDSALRTDFGLRTSHKMRMDDCTTRTSHFARTSDFALRTPNFALLLAHMDWLSRLEAPANAIAVLTAMITPAVLISACGALIFSTGTRLGRVIDRVRFLSAKFEELAKNPQADEMADERRALIFTQLERQMARARLIQRAMVAFYSALGVFVSTSLAIAVLNAVARNYTYVAVALGVSGALFMLYGSVLLIIESRLALNAVLSEMEFVAKVSRKYAGEELAGRPIGGPLTWLGKRIG